MLQVEASLASQLWRGVRFCLSLLVGLTVLTVVFEDKGLGRGMLNNPDMRPEQVSDVRFSDVKGVDEAKVGSVLILQMTHAAHHACGAMECALSSCCMTAMQHVPTLALGCWQLLRMCSAWNACWQCTTCSSGTAAGLAGGLM